MYPQSTSTAPWKPCHTFPHRDGWPRILLGCVDHHRAPRRICGSAPLPTRNLFIWCWTQSRKSLLRSPQRASAFGRGTGARSSTFCSENGRSLQREARRQSLRTAFSSSWAQGSFRLIISKDSMFSVAVLLVVVQDLSLLELVLHLLSYNDTFVVLRPPRSCCLWPPLQPLSLKKHIEGFKLRLVLSIVEIPIGTHLL